MNLVKTLALVLITAVLPLTAQNINWNQIRNRPFTSVTDYGANGDGVTNTATAMQAALTAACASGGSLIIPEGTFLVNTALTCTATSGIHIRGVGPKSVIKLGMGSGSGGLAITGSLAVDKDEVFISDVKFTATGNPDFALKLTGVAAYGLTNVNFDLTADVGLYLVGTQQGYIKGGENLGSAQAIKLERAAYSGANAADISGVTITSTDACLYIDGVDDAFIHGNHITSCPYGIRVISGGSGAIVVDSNHIELNTTAALKTEATWAGAALYVYGNSFFNASPEVEMNILGTGRFMAQMNFTNGDISIGSSCVSCVFAHNYIGGTLTNSATSLQQYGNSAFGSGALLSTATRWYDPIDILPRDSMTPGNMFRLTAPVVDGAWGMKIQGQGTARDVYIQLGSAAGDTDPVVAGSTSGGQINIKSAPGGTDWASFTASGATFISRVVPGTITAATLPAVSAGSTYYCSDCTVTSSSDNTCTGSGTGALAIRLNSIWRCFDSQATASTPTALLQVAENAADNRLAKSVGTSGRTMEATGVTVDDSNNISTAGSISSGVGGSVAGGFEMTQGTLPTPAANSIVINAPTSVTTAYQFTLPGAAATGFRYGTNSSNVVTETFVAAASSSEVTTGTDASKPITPDALAGSLTFGVKTVQIEVFSAGTAATTGDGKAYLYIPASLNGMNLISITGQVYTVGTTGTLNVDIARCATVATGNVCSGTVADVLSTNLTIDSNEDDSGTAATAAVIDTANDDVATGQVYRIDVDAIHTTPSQGLLIILTFQLP